MTPNPHSCWLTQKHKSDFPIGLQEQLLLLHCNSKCHPFLLSAYSHLCVQTKATSSSRISHMLHFSFQLVEYLIHKEWLNKAVGGRTRYWILNNIPRHALRITNPLVSTPWPFAPSNPNFRKWTSAWFACSCPMTEAWHLSYSETKLKTSIYLNLFCRELFFFPVLWQWLMLQAVLLTRHKAKMERISAIRETLNCISTWG